MRDAYRAGVDVLGAVGAGDFAPWLGVVGKMVGGMGGMGGGSQGPDPSMQMQQMQMQMMQQQQQQRQREADSKAKTMQTVLFGVLGLVVVGGGAYLFMKRK